MIKTITFLKRRQDLSRDEFLKAYEAGHAQLGVKTLSGHCERYVRRYLKPIEHPLNEEGKNGAAAGFDALMEMWFKDHAQYEATMALIGSPRLTDEIVDSGHDIFDRSIHFTYVVSTERDSDVSAK